jgi:hypothetical protein
MMKWEHRDGLRTGTCAYVVVGSGRLLKSPSHQHRKQGMFSIVIMVDSESYPLWNCNPAASLGITTHSGLDWHCTAPSRPAVGKLEHVPDIVINLFLNTINSICDTRVMFS